jgi:hypothetical protein
MTNDGAAEKGLKDATKSSNRLLKKAKLAATLAVFAACSAPACNGVVSLGRNNGSAEGSGGANDASAGALSKGAGFGAGGSSPAGSETGGAVVFRDGGPSAVEGPDASQCAAFSQKPETIVVYRDATVTDTVVTHRPAAILFMVDRSSGMNPDAWAAVSAIGAFVDEPASINLDIGIGTFPAGGVDAASCDGTACGSLAVPINSLPENQNAIHAFLSQPAPGPGVDRPTECGLRAMNDICLNYMANSPTGEQCVGVLVTNGSPTACDTNYSGLAQIVADGHAKGVTTFVFSLPGADPSGLNDLASAGGTNEATSVSGGTQAFEQALDTMRDKLTQVTTTLVTTTRIPMVLHTELPCEIQLPPRVFGSMYDLSKVNVLFTSVTGPTELFNYVSSEADCARSSTGAWYYDNAQDPKKIVLCPDTCARIKDSGGSMEIAIGCPV